MYFVIYTRDTEKETIDCGVEYFYALSDAFIFIGSVVDDGYNYKLYKGDRIE